MHLQPSWEAASWAAIQELTKILLNPEVHYRVNKTPIICLYPEPDKSSPYRPFYLRSISVLTTHLRFVLPRVSLSQLLVFPLALPPTFYMHSSSPAFMLHAVPHPILIDFIILIILDECYTNIYFIYIYIYIYMIRNRNYQLLYSSISSLHVSAPTGHTWRRVQVMKLLITQFSPASYHFISSRSEYSPQRPVFKHPQSLFQISHPYRASYTSCPRK
jgi:hypothetical protein